MYADDESLPQCPVEGCRRMAKGPCRVHYNKVYGATSDGVHTGRTPKLNAEQCKAIKKRSSQFASKHQIAVEFKVDLRTISKVLKGTYTPRED